MPHSHPESILAFAVGEYRCVVFVAFAPSWRRVTPVDVALIIDNLLLFVTTFELAATGSRWRPLE
jgi:hypothetical protein